MNTDINHADATRELLTLCHGMLSGRLSFFEGSYQVCHLRPYLSLHDNDPDIQAFVLIESETDHLPLAKVQHLWSQEALQGLQQEFTKTEEWARPFATVACEHLIERLGNA